MGTFKIRHKSKENFSAFSETKNHKIDEPKVEMVQYDIEAKSRLLYEEEARGAVEALMSFLNDLHVGPSPICVTYFDEAHNLGIRFWILLRLLSHQPLATAMWYVFMETKSSISYFSPLPIYCVRPREAPHKVSPEIPPFRAQKWQFPSPEFHLLGLLAGPKCHILLRNSTF
jgi:hypothetical protein